MSDRFDPEVLFSVIPSFYRNTLGTDDRLLLETLWDGLIRCIDAEYAHAVQIKESVKPATAPVKTFYPWVFHEFESWESRRARHRHVVMRQDGNADGRFAYPRFIDLDSAKVYYDGKRVDVSGRSVLTNDPDPAQLFLYYFSVSLLGFQWLVGARLDLLTVSGDTVVADTSFASGSEVVVESDAELFRYRMTGNGVETGCDVRWLDDSYVLSAATVDVAESRVSLLRQCLWMFDTYQLPGFNFPGSPGTTGVVVDDPSAENPTITNPAGFRVGQVLEFVRIAPLAFKAYHYREVVETAGTTYTLQRSKTDSHGLNLSAVNLVLDIPIYPNGVEVEAGLVRFPSVLPPGIRVRVEDPSGSQSFESDGTSSSFSLDRVVDPDETSVFIFNVDLTAVEVTASRFEFGRPLQTGVIAECSAPYWMAHDHARWSTTILVAASYVDLPATRPMALTAGLVQDPRYPVKIYLDGSLMPEADYTFPSTTRIQKASGNFTVGQVIDVVYVDAEDVGDHVHVRSRVEVADGGSIDSVALDGLSLRYPTQVETVGVELLPAANTPVHRDAIVQVHPAVAGPAVVFVDGAAIGQHYEAVIPARVDVDEGYAGTLATADSMQDGIDAPDTTVTGSDLELTIVGRDTRVRSSAAILKAWFKNCTVDEHLIQNNLGLAVGLVDHGESTQRFKDVVLATYAALWSPSTRHAIENFACIVLGSNYTNAGTNRGVRTVDQTRYREVLTADGVVTTALHATIPAREPGPTVPPLYAVSAHARLVDLADVAWLPVFAEAFSPTYRYAKRIDVRSDREESGVVDAFDSSTLILQSNLSDFIDWEVWPGDLIQLTIDGTTDPVYGRVDTVLDATHLRLREAPPTDKSLGWGELTWGCT
jgi:hypothetical protein